MKEPRLYGMRDASAKLGIHPYSLRRMCEDGRIKPLRDSAGRRLFYAEDIEKLAAEREQRRPRQ